MKLVRKDLPKENNKKQEFGGLMLNIFSHSIKVILDNQASSGAYPASPNYPTYRYCWFRDSSFIAYAMDLVGQHDSASHFHDWAAACVNNRAEVITRAITKARNTKRLRPQDYLHARYNLDGSDVSNREWGNFQLDGYGTWLWALGEHMRQTGGPLLEDWAKAAGLVANYLKNLWQYSCYDCWEEFPNKVHPYTLAAIFGGLQAHSMMSGGDYDAALGSIRQYVFENFVKNQHFIKFSGSADVDASLLGLSTPYNLVVPDHPQMQATAAQIEENLCMGGGVHRYSADTFYGGGEWLLLSAWMGWYYTKVGEYKRAHEMLSWVEERTDNSGNMPEQVSTHLLSPSHMSVWEDRWGKAATPLLWSHAMYLILYQQCKIIPTSSV
jgi:GH15 family glucan-1,4-alpha-glucosidase